MKTNNKNKTEQTPLDNNGTTQIPWHPAFVEALQLELEDYKDVLEFHSELQLTTEPLRIDCVVIKKTKEVKIEKTNPGVYTVNGDILPIQIIDNRQLSAENNVWLKNLSNKSLKEN